LWLRERARPSDHDSETDSAQDSVSLTPRLTAREWLVDENQPRLVPAVCAVPWLSAQPRLSADPQLSEFVVEREPPTLFVVD
jgi:hypothetical protein